MHAHINIIRMTKEILVMKFPKFIILPITALLLSGCIMPGGNSGSNSGSNSGDGAQVVADDYYDLTNYNLNGTVGPALQLELHKLMLDSHANYITYGQVNNYLGVTADRPTSSDQFDANTPMNELFYTGKLVPQGQSATREHVWPCANSSNLWYHGGSKDSSAYNVDNKNYVGGGSDLYHVRPSTDFVNTARGNSKFREFTDAEKQSGTLYKSNDGGPYELISTASEYSTVSEPDDHFKGDIARLIMYVYIHYSKIGNYNNNVCGALSLRNVFAGDSEQDVYQLMVRWNELDPVSDTEKLRNDTIQKVQGNRNPFVDYPHLMAKCFGL